MPSQLVPVVDEPGTGDVRARRSSGVAGVEADPQPCQLRVVLHHGADATGLVVGQRVHRVEDERLDAGGAGVPAAVVEQRHQEALGLARAGARRHERRPRHLVAGGQPLPGQGLVPVRREPTRHEVEQVAPTRRRRAKRQPHPDIRPSKDAVRVVGQKLLQLGPHVVVGQRERRA